MVLSSAFKATKLLSTGDVAKALKVHRSTVWLWIKSGAMTSTTEGQFYGVREHDLEVFRATYDMSEAKRRQVTSPKTKTKRTKKRKKK